MRRAALGLLLLGAVAFAPRTFELGLLHDDWGYFHDVANGAQTISSPGGLRPLHGLPWKLCGTVFGDWLPGYYGVLFGLQWLVAVLLYAVARRYAPEGFAAAFAALAMVYPGDASHLWLASMPQRTAWVLALAAVVLAEAQRRRGSDLGVAAAAVLGLLSLAVYELHFLLLAAWPFLATMASGGEGIRWRRRPLILWSAVPVLYLLWRFAVHPWTGGASIVNTEWMLEPLALARRAFLLVPYNLFADGWWIGAVAAVREAPLAAVALFAASAAAGLALLRTAGGAEGGRFGAGRCWAVAVVAIVLGAAPVIPTTYWLGRTAGTFAGRYLAAALPGAALLLLLAIVYSLREPRSRAVAFAALMTVAVAFHWNVGRLAAEHWQTQQDLVDALRGTASDWPEESFLVVLDLPPNRLGYDTPWGVGRLIREATGEPTLSGIGLGADRSPDEVLTAGDGALRVHGGAFATVPLRRVAVLRWQDGRLRRASLEDLLEDLLLEDRKLR